MPVSDSSSRPGFVLSVDERTPALLTLSGTTPRLQHFDVGTQVLYPCEPQDDVRRDEAVRAAVDAAGLDAAAGARRVTVLLSDPTLPQPAMRADVRSQLLEAVLDRLARLDVTDVQIVLATGLGRQLPPEAVETLVGERVWRSFSVLDAISSHDAEAEDLVTLGDAGGATVRVNRAVAEADLVVDLRVVAESGWAADAGTGGWVDVAVGAAGVDTVQAIRGARARSDAGAAIAGLLAQHIPMVTVAAVLGQPAYRAPLRFLGEREWDWKAADHASYRAVRRALSLAHDATARRLYRQLSADYSVVAVHGGDPDAVDEQVRRALVDSQGVAAPEPADLLALGVRHPNPAGDGSISNPIAAAWDALARGGHAADPRLLRDGGSLVVFHSLEPRFSTRLHHASSDFWTEALADGPDLEAVAAHEERLRTDPWLLQLYRERFGFHPLQPFHLWYACQPAIRRAHEVIYVGASRADAARLGGRAATRWSDALEIARANAGADPVVTYVHNTGPVVVKDRA